MKFYRCPVCGNVIVLPYGNVKNVKCCGKELEELTPNTTDAALEKHVPVYTRTGDDITVKVGEVEHPMTKEHYITFIAQVYDNKVDFAYLNPGDKPEAKFKYVKNSILYEYCNIHGLWSKEVK
jgi:superoxide reductase